MKNTFTCPYTTYTIYGVGYKYVYCPICKERHDYSDQQRYKEEMQIAIKISNEQLRKFKKNNGK